MRRLVRVVTRLGLTIVNSASRSADRPRPPYATVDTFAANEVSLQLGVLAYNLGNFMRTPALPKTAQPWSLTSLPGKQIKIGANFVTYSRCVTFQMAEVAVPRRMFADILSLIARPQAPPARV
jgi:hypothetical protein